MPMCVLCILHYQLCPRWLLTAATNHSLSAVVSAPLEPSLHVLLTIHLCAMYVSFWAN